MFNDVFLQTSCNFFPIAVWNISGIIIILAPGQGLPSTRTCASTCTTAAAVSGTLATWGSTDGSGARAASNRSIRINSKPLVPVPILLLPLRTPCIHLRHYDTAVTCGYRWRNWGSCLATAVVAAERKCVLISLTRAAAEHVNLPAPLQQW